VTQTSLFDDNIVQQCHVSSEKETQILRQTLSSASILEYAVRIRSLWTTVVILHWQYRRKIQRTKKNSVSVLQIPSGNLFFITFLLPSIVRPEVSQQW